MGRSWVRFPAAALSRNDLGQVVHTNVPLFTKQYKLVACDRGLSCQRAVCGRKWHGSNEQGEYCSNRFSSDLDRLEPLHKLSTLLYFYFTLALSLFIARIS